MKYEPVNVDARLGLANALRRSGQLAPSLSEYEHPEDRSGPVRARFGYVAALIRLNRYQEASERLAEAMDLYPNEPVFARAATRLFAAAPDDAVTVGALAIGHELLRRQPRTIDWWKHWRWRRPRPGSIQRSGAVAA